MFGTKFGKKSVSPLAAAMEDGSWGRGRKALSLALALAGALAVSACANKGANSKKFGPGSGAAYGANGGRGGPVKPGSSRDFTVNVGDIVYFGTAVTTLSPEAQQTVDKQAGWLKRYPRYTITIEGHADERGTREYNIALGARRAAAVRSYLASRGINPARIRTVSYGKERPVAVCNDISCWSQNRRAQTILNRRRGAGS